MIHRMMVRIILGMYINCLSKRWPSLICDVDHGLRLVRPLLNCQHNVSNSLQTIIYIFSIFDLPRSNLGRDLRENAATCFSSRRETINPCILIDLYMTWKMFWNDQKIRRQYGREGNYINLYGVWVSGVVSRNHATFLKLRFRLSSFEHERTRNLQ